MNKSKVPTQRQFHRLFQSAFAESRRKDAKEQAEFFRQNQKETNLLRRKQKQIKRNMSQINFSSQHWWKQQPWKEQFTNSAKTPLEEQKAAVWYEAARRRPEIQEAWVKGQFVFGANGWQHFTGWVVQNLSKSWPELESIVKGGLIKSSYSLWSPGSELHRMRIENAKRLLLQSNMKVDEVAELSGYQSSNSFWIAFKQSTGLSPKKFQKQVCV